MSVKEKELPKGLQYYRKKKEEEIEVKDESGKFVPITYYRRLINQIAGKGKFNERGHSRYRRGLWKGDRVNIFSKFQKRKAARKKAREIEEKYDLPLHSKKKKRSKKKVSRDIQGRLKR